MGKENPTEGSSATGFLNYAESSDQITRSLPNPPKTTWRINSSGCLGRCSEGPVIVVYPEGIWYKYQTQADIDEILNEHVVNGRIVERLKI